MLLEGYVRPRVSMKMQVRRQIARCESATRCAFATHDWDSVDLLRVIWPFGPIWLEKESDLEKESTSTGFQLFWLFFDSIFNFLNRQSPGTHFRTFFQLWARRAQMTPVAGKSFCKPPDVNRTRFQGFRDGHRVLQGHPRVGGNFTSLFQGSPDPFGKALK